MTGNSTRTPWPPIDAAAWTALLRPEDGQPITTETAAAHVGPDRAAEAVAQLVASHIVDPAGEVLQLGQTFRRWYRGQYIK